MKTLRSIFAFILVTIFTFTGVLGNYNAFAASQYGEEKQVENNKVWKVKFTSELSENTINSSNIFVKNESGNIVSTNLKLLTDKKTVEVSPLKEYSAGRYILYVTNGIKNIYGRSLDSEKQISFTVKGQDEKPIPNGNFRITIDAGHGGVDPGITGLGGNKEKDIDLAVALKLGDYLKNKGIDVIYTRESDDVSWGKDEVKPRFDVANSSKSDFYLTIHCNSAGTDNATGTETIYKGSDGKGGIMANLIQGNIGTVGFADRKSKEGTSPDISGINIPSAKVILGFLTSPIDENRLVDSSIQSKFAKAIGDAVVEYSKDSAPAVKSVEKPIIPIKQGQTPNLPKTLKVTLTDGTTINDNVTWDLAKLNNKVVGTYGVEGKLSTTGGRALAVVVVISSNNSAITVTIDPGHGGFDPGTVYNNVYEKDIALPVSLKVGKILQSKGVNVVYTRTSDDITFPREETANLQARCDISNAAKANYFIAVHCNSAAALQAKGIETYYASSEGDGPARWFAQNVQSEVIASTGAVDRRVKQEDYHVLECTNAPAILIELGFITNAEEVKNLRSSAYQDKLAQGIANGILKSIGLK